MGAGRAGGDHGAVGALEPMLDRDVTGSEIDDAAGNEEWRNAARTTLLQQDTGVGDAAGAADAGANQDAARDLILVARGLPAGVVERLLGRAHGVDDEFIDLALLLRLHPLVWI